MYVEIDDSTALEMLVDRVKFWDDDSLVVALYEEMYENMIDNGFFNGGEFDVNSIVDNDYVNWCTIYYKGDDGYEDIIIAWNGRYNDVDGIGYIEAECDGAFLVRSY